MDSSQEPLEGGGAMVNNLSKFAKLAWSITRSSRPAAGKAGAGGGGLEGSSSSKSNLKNIVELPRPSFLDSLPTYRHEPPKTPPHILLHYSTFKVTYPLPFIAFTLMHFFLKPMFTF